MKRLLLLTFYLLLSLGLTSAQDSFSQKPSQDPSPPSSPSPKPSPKPSSFLEPSPETSPKSSKDGVPFDNIVDKKVGWNYDAKTLALACIFLSPKYRKDSEWQENLTKRIDGLRYSKDSKAPIGYRSESRALGLVFVCFQAYYGNFLDLIRTHGDGIQAYIDYSKIYNHKFPKPQDNDQYPAPNPSGGKNSNQKTLRSRHKRTLLSLRETPVRSLRQRTSDLLTRSVSKFQGFKIFAKRSPDGDHAFLFKRQDNNKPDDSISSLRRSVDFTQDTAVFSTEPPGLDLEDEYIFDENDGRNSTVYIIDGGINANHSAFAWKQQKDPKNIGWIWGGPRPSDRQEDHSPNPTDTSVRGSHVAAKVIGAVSGLARLASTYMVILYDADGGLNILTYLDALVKMHDHIKTTSGANPNKKVVICFSHPVVHVARSQEFIRWPQYKNMTQSKKEFMNTATGILDGILEDFGIMKNVVMVTRATGLLLDKSPDPLLSWPARRANTGNVTNLVVVGGVNSNGVKIMQAPSSVLVYAPAQDIRVPILHHTNLNAYTTIPYSIRLSVGSVSGLLAFFMSKYSEDGRAAKNRLEANAYPRIKFGYSVAWNGLRTPSCGFDTSKNSKDGENDKGDEKKPPKAKRADPRLDYNEGTPVKCALNPFRAEVTTVRTSINGSVTEFPKMNYFHAADGPGYTHKIPRIPKPTIYRPSFAVTITSTTSVGVARYSSDYEKYKDMLRSGKPPGPAGAKPGVRYDRTETVAPMMTTDKFGRTGEVFVVWKTVYTSAKPAGTGTTIPLTTAVSVESTLSTSTWSRTPASHEVSPSTVDVSSSQSTTGPVGTSSTAMSTSSSIEDTKTLTTGPSGTRTPSSTITPAPSQ
ncbi:uncharacterized protein DFL_006738 [Arthrobotrys flagrans]|uniref:Peptidase S8/S53 domain-containing protein n=1 Tax=Arthrobotrys flagrans TaxID=97331 RepID=A0A436ZTS3_ARTFL|nr:hypothetical protein DFL_006738 [Arthrobotrys flagrans]